MNLKKIIDKNKFLKFFENHLFSEENPFKENQKKVFFDFKIDSYLPFVLAKLSNNNLIIFSNFKEAAYFINDIKSLNFSDCILFPHIDSNDDDEAKSQIKKERSGTRQIIENIKKGNSVALMIDQRVREGIKINFFGKPASTTTIPAQLIKKYKCDLVPIYIERRKNNYFKMFVSEPIKIGNNKSIKEITEHLNKILEKMILKNVDQWIWTHDRWKK